jgi:hypothetical protein
MIKSIQLHNNLKNYHSVILILLFMALRVIVISHFNIHYGNGDNRAYEKIARDQTSFSLPQYFEVTPDYLHKLSHYQYTDTIGIFPYLDIETQTFWEPGYILLLKLLYAVNDSNNFVIFFQYFLSLIIVFVWIKIIETSFPIKRSLLISLFIIFHPFFLTHPALLYTEILDSLLIGLCIYFGIKNQGSRNILLGLCAGLLAITESFYLPLILFGYICLYIKHRSWRFTAAQLIPLLIITAPLLYHNYVYTAGDVTLATKNSYNLWANNNVFPPINYDQNENGSPASEYFKDNSIFQNPRSPCKTSLKDQQGCELKSFLNFVLASPGLFMSRALLKWQNFWSPNLFGFNFGFNLHALGLNNYWSAILNNLYMVFEIVFQLIFVICFCLCFFQKNMLLNLMTAHFIFIHIVIAIGLGMIRYRYPLVPEMIAIIFIAATSKKFLMDIKARPIRFYTLLSVCLFFMISNWIIKIPLIWRTPYP